MFKDDQLQSHNHQYRGSFGKYGQISNPGQVYADAPLGTESTSTPTSGRSGTVTRGKRKAVKYIIKVL